MGKLPGKEAVLEGYVDGDFPQSYLPAALVMKIKKGAQIMMLNNDSGGRWVNGTVGQIVGIVLDGRGELEEVEVKLSDGKKYFVTRNTWDVYHFYLKGKEIDSKKSVLSFSFLFALRLR